jgi:hypothetical protein
VVAVLIVRVDDCGLALVKLITEDEKVHDTVAGRPLHVSSTEPESVAVGVTVTENVPLCPCRMVAEDGFTVRVKLGGGGTTPGMPLYSYTPISMIAVGKPVAFWIRGWPEKSN